MDQTGADRRTEPGARRFLEALHGQAVERGLYFAIWEKQEKGTRFFRDLDAAASCVARLRDEARDVYASVGAFRSPLVAGRGTAADIRALPGFWMDVDVGDHGNGRIYPPTREDALALVEEMGVRPTILVWSGRGLHLYVLFKELWVLDTEQERERAASLVRRFVATVQAHAKRRGWALDSVGDLARVLRVPGTINSAAGVPVTIALLDESARCNPDDVEPLLVPDEGPKGESGQAKRARSPDDALTALQCLERMDPRLADDYETWLRIGMALHAIDPGPTMLAAWDAWSRKSGKYEPGACEAKWATFGGHPNPVGLGTLIHLAGGDMLKHLGRLDAEPAPEGEADGVARREDVLATLGGLFGRPVRAWLKLEGEEPVYTLVLDDPAAEITIGGAEAVRSPRRFAAKLYQHGIHLEPAILKRWPLVLKAFLQAETPVTNPDGLRLSRVHGLLEAYVQKATVHRGEAWHECFARSEPCLYDGTLCLHAPTLRTWLMECKGERVERGQLYDDLRAFGFRPRSLSHASWKTSRSYWALSEDEARERFPGLFPDPQ